MYVHYRLKSSLLSSDCYSRFPLILPGLVTLHRDRDSRQPAKEERLAILSRPLCERLLTPIHLLPFRGRILTRPSVHSP